MYVNTRTQLSVNRRQQLQRRPLYRPSYSALSPLNGPRPPASTPSRTHAHIPFNASTHACGDGITASSTNTNTNTNTSINTSTSSSISCSCVRSSGGRRPQHAPNDEQVGSQEGHGVQEGRDAAAAGIPATATATATSASADADVAPEVREHNFLAAVLPCPASTTSTSTSTSSSSSSSSRNDAEHVARKSHEGLKAHLIPSRREGGA